MGVTDPEPVFVDDNLTVYGIPLSSSKSLDKDVEPDSTFQAGSKRKRSPSPESPSKRGPNETHSESRPLPLKERMRTKSFDPTTLQGVDAQEWRKMNVLNMFGDFEELTTTREKAEATPADKNLPGAASSSFGTKASADETRVRPARRFFPNFKQRLPEFRYPSGQAKKTLCYVCVGPRQRGRFDNMKAKELGIPNGPIRGRLVAGETIKFTVDDGKGGKVERVVRPEECLGASEAPKASLLISL